MKFTNLIVASFLTIIFLGNLPTVVAQTSTSGVKLFPDWNMISLQDLDSVEQNGQINDQYNEAAGYEVERQWTAGQNPESILKVGDLENSLSPQEFTLFEITDKSESTEVNDATSIRLSDFSLAGEQTIRTLVSS